MIVWPEAKTEHGGISGDFPARPVNYSTLNGGPRRKDLLRQKSRLLYLSMFVNHHQNSKKDYTMKLDTERMAKDLIVMCLVPALVALGACVLKALASSV